MGRRLAYTLSPLLAASFILPSPSPLWFDDLIEGLRETMAALPYPDCELCNTSLEFLEVLEQGWGDRVA